jgi:Tol biopolymer transport system component
VLLLGACGRLAFDPTGDGAGNDATGSGNGDGADAADPTGLGPFGAPMQQGALGSTRDDQSPTLTADLLEIYFMSSRGCGNCADIFVAKRTSITDPWGTPALVAEINDAAKLMTPEISPDGLTLWFASEQQGPAGGSDIWVTTRPDRMSAWALPVRDPRLSTAAYDLDPSLSSDGLTMTLSATDPGFTYGDIMISTRASTTAAWSTPVPISELNTTALEGAAQLRDNGRTLYFCRQTPANNFDIYVVTRASTSDPFGTPVPLGSLNSASLDFDAWVSEDQHTIFFSSDRTGDLEIYAATR